MLLISHNVFNSFKDMLENRKTLKAGSIFPVRQGSSLTKQTQRGLTHWVCLHAHSQFYHHIIKAGINRSGHLDYYSIFQWNGSNHHSNINHKADYTRLLEYQCARTHNTETHRRHTRQTEGWDGWLTKRDTSFFFSFPFFIYLWFKILIGWNDVCGSFRVIIELRVM